MQAIGGLRDPTYVQLIAGRTCIAFQPSPIVALIAQTCRCLQVVHVDKIDSLAFQLSPKPIPRTDGPAWLIPVS